MSNSDNTLPLILASASPRRRELLTQIGLQFDVEASDASEDIDPSLPPARQVELLSERKAETVARNRSQGLVIGSDTVVVLGNKVLGKPQDSLDAEQMLGELSGQEHTVFTGLCLLDIEGKRRRLSHQATKVWMRPLSISEIQAYVKSGEPLDKAGAYGIQGLGASLVEKVSGDFYAVVGLPLALLSIELKHFGFQIPG